MANLQSDTVDNRRSWRELLWLLAVLVALAWQVSDAAAQDGRNMSAPVPPASGVPSAIPNAGGAGPSPDNSLAAASPPDQVVDVKILGNKALPMERILPSIRTRAGRPFDLQLIAEDVRRLDRTRQFVNVKSYHQKVAGGRIVYFEVIERPLLTEVKFVGSYYIHKRKLQKESELKAGDPADPNTIEEARRKLEELYHKRGYNSATVSLFEGNKPEDRRAIFVVNEGPKQCVWKTEFVGNTIADGDRLATQIGSKHPFLYLFGGEYDRKKVEEDVEKLTNYYRGLGFFRARVGHELEFNQKENWVTIRFVIDEGPRYKVRNVSVIGNKKYGTEELLGESKLKVTNYFNQASMDADTRAISDKYGSVGYVFADIKPDLRFLEEPGQLDIVYNISEGDRYRVGKINIQIKGEYSHTQENTVRNRLFFKPGDIVDIREIRASEVALKRSQLFESNPAQGNAPKIVFTPPDQDGMIRENDKRQQMAGRPRTPDSPDSRFRGQSPDSDSCDRELNLVIDCGRLVARPIAPPPAAPVPPSVGAVGYGETMVAPNAGAANGAYAPRAEAMQVGYEASSAEAAPSELDLAVQAYSEALSRAEQQRARVQYLAPDDSMANQGALPRNDAPGDYAQPSRFDNGPSAVQPQEESLDEEVRGVSAKAAAVAAEKEARQLQGTRPRIGLLETQYSSGGGQVNPATTSNPFQQWRSPTASGNENRQTAPSYVASRPESAPYPATNGSMVSQQIPASPMPGNGVDGAGPNGQEAVTQSPQGHMVPGPIFSPDSPFNGGAPDDGGPPARPLDIDIRTEETMTGKLMFGVGVNSDAGLVGSVVLDEQNFDWTRFPNSWEDVRNASAWRGAGQRFRIEAVPGTQVQRYMVSFAEPYMFGTQVSNGLSGYFFNRIYSEYNEQRLGGRVSFGYQFSPSLAGGIAYRGAKVNITDPADPFLPALAEVTGRDLALHGFQLSMQHDTRDNAFLATEGHLIEGSVEQVLGSFQYPQALLDIRKYFTMYERPDGSGRHVLSLSTHFGWTGDNTPIYERFYSGGFSTIRGFQFRRASPLEVGPSTGTNIVVGGNFQMLASAEYMFPITADDMVRGVIFCDTGTTEPSINDWSNKYRVAPGFGLRISVPAMGPAPIALDFAFPVSWQPGDKSELFSFFMGFGR